MFTSLRIKLYSGALSAVMAAGALGVVAPSAHAADTAQQYLATNGVPTISATQSQINLPFAPDLYYSYSQLSDIGKQVWNWTIKDLLAFDPDKNYNDPAVSFTTLSSGDGVLTFDLHKKGITAKVDDIKSLNNFFVWNEPRLFILRDWGKTKHTVDAQGVVQTISFTIAKNYMGKGQYQGLLTQMESTITDILSEVDPRQDDAQRLNALYNKYLAQEHYVNAGTPGSMPGAFLKGQVVCGGYSKGFEYLSMRAGVPSAYILGYPGGGYHAWNAVKMEDGKWYYIDTTWDDQWGNAGYSNRTWFLKGTNSVKRTIQNGTLKPEIAQTNYTYKTWVAPETVAPQSKKAIDQIVSAVKKTFSDNTSSLISQMTKVTATLSGPKSSSGSFQDQIILNNLGKDIKALKLQGSATITISTDKGALNNLNDILTKGLTIDYTAPNASQSYQYANGKFIDKSTGKALDEATVAAKVLDLGQKTVSRVLEAHSANAADITGLSLSLPANNTLAYTPKNTTEQKVLDQIKTDLQGKFDGELSVMVVGGFSSTADIISKGLVIGYKDPSGTYYTLMGGKVIASAQQQK